MDNEAINNEIISTDTAPTDSATSRKKGIIKKFSSLSFGGISLMHDDLALQMNVGELGKCQSMYRLMARDDISTDEIYFLDSYICARKNSPDALAPKEVLTNNKYIADTYADLMKKCVDLDIFALTPASVNLAELFSVGGKYAEFSGGAGNYFTAQATREFSSVIDASALQIAPASKNEPLKVRNQHSDKPCYINDGTFTASFARRSLKKNASIAVLLSDNLDASLNTRIHKLLSDKNLTREFFGYSVVSDSLTDALRSLCGSYGVKIDMNALEVLGIHEPYEAELALQGRPIIAFASKHEKSIKALAESLGLIVLTFASVQKIYNFTIVKDSAALFNIPLRYLNELHPLKNKIAEIEDNAFCKDKFSLNFGTVNGDKNKPCDVLNVHGKLFASSVSSNIENKYFSTLYALLGAVSKLVASGVALSDVFVSYELEAKYPESNKAFGNILSSLLGIYRAHAELTLSSSETSLKLSKENTREQFTAFVFGENPRGSDRDILFPFERVFTYLYEPDFDESGIVDFDSLRFVLRFLECGNRKVVFARALCFESPRSVLGENAICNELDLEEKKALAFLIQSPEELELSGLKLLKISKNPPEV